MSAAPMPKPDPDPAPEPNGQADADGWALLEALRRRLDDQGAQGRKTQHQVTQLAESIGALVAEQRRRSKWANLNSFVAYVLFTLLVGAGFYLLYRSRAHELVEARDSAQRERDQAVHLRDELSAKATARETADGKAWEVYQLLEAGKRSEAAGKLDALTALPLSRTERAVLAARAHETQVMEVDAALKSAAASFKAGRYADVIAPLEAALISEPAGARASTMRYYLGIAYAKGNQLDKAIQLLSASVAADVDQDDARFQLASALDRGGQYAKARTEYDRFATAHPQSQLAVFAMRRSATLARMPATAPVVAPPAAPPIVPQKPLAPAPQMPVAPAMQKPAVVAPTPVAPAMQKPPIAPKAVAPAAQKLPPKPAPQKPVLPPQAEPAPAPSTDEKTEPMSAQPFAVPKSEPMSAQPFAAPKPPPAKEPPPPPAKEPPPAEPAPPSSPKLPPAPRADPGLPSFPIDRTPPPSPLGPPVEKDPAPAPNAPPRGDVPAPPPLRF